MPKNKEKNEQKKEQKKEQEEQIYDGAKIWDEILKAIVDTMPTQLHPLYCWRQEHPRFWGKRKRSPAQHLWTLHSW